MRSESVPDRVLRTIRAEGLIDPGEDVTVALSGGADSVALLSILRELQPLLGITLRAAHFHHGIRGAEADRDVAFCKSLCDDWGVPLKVGRGVAPAYAEEHGLSLETAARELRYAFLHQAAPGKLATAHTADDNAETLLMHLIRGAGPRGLGGILPRRGSLIRPLLAVEKRELLEYLSQRGIPHVEDSTNESDDGLRNRVRHRIMPLLTEENPQLLSALGRATRLARAEDGYLSRLAAEASASCRLADGWSCAALLDLDPVLRRRILCSILQDLGLDSPAEANVADLEALLRNPRPSAALTLPGGVRVCRRYDALLPNPPAPGPELPVCPLNVPGQTDLPLQIGRITCFVTKNSDFSHKNVSTFCVKYDMITPRGWTVRARRPGDRLRHSGGVKTVKALMIDRKIPVSLRGRLPVLFWEDRLIGVFGLGMDPAYAAAPGEDALLLQFEPPAPQRGRGE